jgi:hypothetical protein
MPRTMTVSGRVVELPPNRLKIEKAQFTPERVIFDVAGRDSYRYLYP